MRTDQNRLSFLDLLLAMVAKLPRKDAIAAAHREIENLSNDLPISLGLIMEQNALRYSDRPAIYFEDVTYTHFEFNAVINQYAHYFHRIGIGKGTVVVVFLENRLATVILIAALSKLGAIASLINANQRI